MENFIIKKTNVILFAINRFFFKTKIFIFNKINSLIM